MQRSGRYEKIVNFSLSIAFLCVSTIGNKQKTVVIFHLFFTTFMNDNQILVIHSRGGYNLMDLIM